MRKIKKTKVDIIVSRHKSFLESLELLAEKFNLDLSEAVIKPEVTKEEIKNKVVLTSGLPNHIAIYAAEILEPYLEFPRDPDERARIIKAMDKDPQVFMDQIKGLLHYTYLKINETKTTYTVNIDLNNRIVKIYKGKHNAEVLFNVEKVKKEGNVLKIYTSRKTYFIFGKFIKNYDLVFKERVATVIIEGYLKTKKINLERGDKNG